MPHRRSTVWIASVVLAMTTGTVAAVGAPVLAAVPVLPPAPPIIVGGPAAISSSVEDQVASAASLTTERIAGANRYETAVEISKILKPLGSKGVFVVSGENFPDALGVGPVAGKGGSPILLTQQDSLPASTKAELERLSPLIIYIVGGTAVISSDVEAEIATIAPVERIAGANRYATAVEVSKKFFTSADVVAMASGTSFPDGLTIGVRAGIQDRPLLLTDGKSVTPGVIDELNRLGATHVSIAGGPAVVEDSVQTALEGAGFVVLRIWGSDRYLTASTIAGTWSEPDGIFVASGLAFPDALAVTPLAVKNNAPILLTAPSSLPIATSDRIEFFYSGP